MDRIIELKQKRTGLIEQAEAIYTLANAENRSLTDDEQANFEGLMKDADKLETEIRNLEGLEKRKLAFGGQGANGNTRPDPEPDDPAIGMSADDLRNYSVMRAIRALVGVASGDQTAVRDAGLELDASRAVADKLGVEPRGILVPYDVMSERREMRVSREQRDMVVYDPTKGGYLVDTVLAYTSFIELLRNKMMLKQAGAIVLGGLVGDLSIPRRASGATAYWIGEGKAPTESEGTVEQVLLTPKTCGAFTDLSRKFLKQSSLDAENFVRDDLALCLAVAIDYAGLHGAGSANQPLGLANVTGIGAVVGGTNGAAPDWADVIDLETEVSVDNADLGALAYMTNAAARGKLKKTMRTATYGDIPIWDVSNEPLPLNGYPAHVTNQVRSDLTKGSGTDLSAIFFGNWADIVIGMWGTVDITVDPYTQSTQGNVRVVAHQDVDYAVRHPESFAAMLDAITT